MYIDELSPRWRKVYFLVPVYILFLFPLSPFLITYALWKDEWDSIKTTYAEMVSLLRIPKKRPSRKDRSTA